MKEGNGKVGNKILNKLCEYYGYKRVSNVIVDEVQLKINEIYNDIYYKKQCNYEKNLNWLEMKINEKYIINPIFLLFRLLLICNSNFEPSKIIKNHQNLYNELKKFENFFTEELIGILEILDIVFTPKLDETLITKKYKNELSYFTLGAKCILEKRYFESIQFCLIAKTTFMCEENHKRVYYVNLNLMASYNYVQRYDDAYALSKKQMQSLLSIQNIDFVYATTRRHYLISCIGLKRYEEVEVILENVQVFTKTELCCLLVAKYNKSKEEYKKLYEYILETTSTNNLFLNALNDYLLYKNKDSLKILESDRIVPEIIEILKKM